MRYLVAIGCSHTNGSMLDGTSGSSEYNIRNGFPGMIAKKFGMQLHNISKPGASNQYIHRTLFNYVCNHADFDNHEYLFLIGWTGHQRIELRYPDETAVIHQTKGDYTDHKHVPFTMGTDPGLFKTQELRRLLNYGPFVMPDVLLQERWASYALGVQSYLRNRNIPYLMHNTCDPLRRLPGTMHIIKQLDHNHYLEPTAKEGTYLEYCLSKSIKRTECWHFKEDGHAAWAEVLQTRLKHLGYV